MKDKYTFVDTINCPTLVGHSSNFHVVFDRQPLVCTTLLQTSEQGQALFVQTTSVGYLQTATFHTSVDSLSGNVAPGIGEEYQIHTPIAGVLGDLRN